MNFSDILNTSQEDYYYSLLGCDPLPIVCQEVRLLFLRFEARVLSLSLFPSFDKILQFITIAVAKSVV